MAQTIIKGGGAGVRHTVSVPAGRKIALYSAEAQTAGWITQIGRTARQPEPPYGARFYFQVNSHNRMAFGPFPGGDTRWHVSALSGSVILSIR
jgi:hypothetical protein